MADARFALALVALCATAPLGLARSSSEDSTERSARRVGAKLRFVREFPLEGLQSVEEARSQFELDLRGQIGEVLGIRVERLALHTVLIDMGEVEVEVDQGGAGSRSPANLVSDLERERANPASALWSMSVLSYLDSEYPVITTEPRGSNFASAAVWMSSVASGSGSAQSPRAGSSERLTDFGGTVNLGLPIDTIAKYSAAAQNKLYATVGARLASYIAPDASKAWQWWAGLVATVVVAVASIAIFYRFFVDPRFVRLENGVTCDTASPYRGPGQLSPYREQVLKFYGAASADYVVADDKDGSPPMRQPDFYDIGNGPDEY